MRGFLVFGELACMSVAFSVAFLCCMEGWDCWMGVMHKRFDSCNGLIKLTKGTMLQHRLFLNATDRHEASKEKMGRNNSLFEFH